MRPESQLQLAGASEWKRVFDGVNEAARGIYLILDGRMRERGLERAAAAWTPLDELRERLGIDARVAHRFRLAVAGLRNIGSVELDGERVRAAAAPPPETTVDDDLIRWTFGPLADVYRQFYETDTVFDPGFAFAFDAPMDEIWDGLLNAPMNAYPRDLAVAWAASPGARVLDLGFGTPHSLRQLAGAVGDGGRVDGIDVSQHFVERARAELAGVEAIGRIERGDANDGLPGFADGELDGVVFMGALHFVDDPAALFAELARVARPRARLAVGMFFTDRPCFAAPCLQLHRSFFDPPGVLRSEREVVDALWRAGFEVKAAVHVGSYCSLYVEQCSEVQDPFTGT